MKVLNLRCANDHRFEGWFASEDDFVSQDRGDLVQCPVCSDTGVVRLPSAPRINVGATRDEPATVPVDPQKEAQSHWMRTLRKVIANTEDVGPRFAEEARRIHYGEAEERGIRGQASPKDAEALRDEGIDVYALALPDALKGPVQ